MRSKYIGDAELFMCSLSAVLVFKKSICLYIFSFNSSFYFLAPDGKYDKHVYVFLNFGNRFKNDSNYFLSCLLLAINRMPRIPRSWICQIDNFQGNKSYDVLASLGWLLPAIGLNEVILLFK